MKILFCTTDETCISFFDAIEQHLDAKLSAINNMDLLQEQYEANKYEMVFIDNHLGLSSEIEDFILDKNPSQKIILANFPIEFLFTNCCRYKSMNNFRSISSLNNISKIVYIITSFEKIECSDNKCLILKDYIDNKCLHFIFDIESRTIKLKYSHTGSSSYTLEFIFLIDLLKKGSIEYIQTTESEIRITGI